MLTHSLTHSPTHSLTYSYLLTYLAQYEPLLREALRRRPAECDVLVVSLGYDTLDGDP